MTAGEILDAVRAHRGMNKVTLYRLLEEFIQRDILRRVSLESRSSHYEMACGIIPPTRISNAGRAVRCSAWTPCRWSGCGRSWEGQPGTGRTASRSTWRGYAPSVKVGTEVVRWNGGEMVGLGRVGRGKSAGKWLMAARVLLGACLGCFSMTGMGSASLAASRIR